MSWIDDAKIEAEIETKQRDINKKEVYDAFLTIFHEETAKTKQGIETILQNAEKNGLVVKPHGEMYMLSDTSNQVSYDYGGTLVFVDPTLTDSDRIAYIRNGVVYGYLWGVHTPQYRDTFSICLSLSEDKIPIVTISNSSVNDKNQVKLHIPIALKDLETQIKNWLKNTYK